MSKKAHLQGQYEAALEYAANLKAEAIAVLEVVADDDPMVQDEQGGCVWCGVDDRRRPFCAPRNPEKHDATCGWALARKLLVKLKGAQP